MKIFNVWVGVHGYDWYALVRANDETDAITKLMTHIGNAADAALLTHRLAEELKLTEELSKFIDNGKILHIYEEGST